MPVDLCAIPDISRRFRQPSVKRWLVMLLIFMVCGGFLTSWLWPANAPARGALFWHCFISAPLGLWAITFGCRWLVWLSTEWPANGWDDEREQDIRNEIQRGQSFLVLDAATVCLPHVVTSGELTQQFLLPQGIRLPSVVDTTTQSVNAIARFNDHDLPAFARIQNRLQQLLHDPQLQAALFRRQTTDPLQVILQVDSAISLVPVEQEDLHKWLINLLPASNVQFAPRFGLADIDSWLDNPGLMGTLLVLSVCIRPTITDGEGEAAVALLLHTGEEEGIDSHARVRIHRPEQSKDAEALYASAMQSLVWGKTRAEDIASLWLAGMGTGNKTQSLLSKNKLRFPRAEANAQIVDIDMKTGRTGVVSFWLAAALAAGHSGTLPFSQLIMSSPEEGMPWWTVIHPGKETS